MIFDVPFMIDALGKLVKLVPLTLEITALSFVLGFVVGIFVALVRLYRVKVLHIIADAYVAVIRGTPMLLHVYIVYYGTPKFFGFLADTTGWSVDVSGIPSVVFLIVALTINSGAYMSEVVRSGIIAVGAGEIEAGYSIGMTTPLVFKRIILPQALEVSLPNLCNSMIAMLHGSALASFVGVAEVTCMANVLAGDNWKFFEAYVAAGILYWIIAIIIEQIMLFLEKIPGKKREKAGAVQIQMEA
ncbi:amino acid ABC transporter permease [Lachnospiraceae bacterium ZAX-1]